MLLIMTQMQIWETENNMDNIQGFKLADFEKQYLLKQF